MRRLDIAPVRLVRPADRRARPTVVDASTRRVLEHRGGPLLVLAGPGTGKTTTLVEAVVRRVERDGLEPDQALVLTFSRQSATQLRQRIVQRLGRPVREPLARTFHSYAFGLLRREAVLQGRPAPRLLGGVEQDVVVRELLHGDAEAADRAPWPQRFRAALLTQGFAEQVRDLLMRATERGVGADELERLARAHGRDDWAAAAQFARQYGAVTAFRQPPVYDQAELVRTAVMLLRDDPRLLEAERQARRFVAVDEYQDCDPAHEELLALLAGGGRDLLVVGDPDQSIYGFRGAEPEVIRQFPDRFPTADGQPAPVLALTVSRRSGPALLAATRRVAARLGGPPAHRRLVAGPDTPDGQASVHVLASASQEAAFVAGRLRAAHLFDEVPWSSMAVLVRAGSAIGVVRRALEAAGVPARVRSDEVPLIDQAPARALITILEVAVGRRGLDREAVEELLTGPFGGADPLTMRRLRQELRRQELATGGDRRVGELIAEALDDVALLRTLDQRAVRPALRVATMVAAGRAAAADGGRVEDILWAIWSSSDREREWTTTALSSSRAADRADADLDAVCATFEAAARFEERMPGASADAFARYLRDQRLPMGPTSGGGRPRREAVTVCTAHAAKGLEWDVVAVVGVTEGVWPDLRERGSLLGAETLVEQVAQRDSAAVTRASARLAEERRLFYVAVTRARRRLYVTAVADDETQPSRFLDDLDPRRGQTDAQAGGRQVEQLDRALSVPALVAHLRQIVCDPAESPDRRSDAAYQLTRLAAAGVRQAHPHDWYGLRPLSVAEPAADPGRPVRVSPSKVEEFSRCELRWLLKSCGAQDGEVGRAAAGSLVHALAERAAVEEWSEDKLLAAFDDAWPSLDAGEGWVAAREYHRVRDMVGRLARWLRDRPRRMLGVELDFDVEVGQARLVGRVDRLEVDRDGRLVVVDFKTGVTAVTAGELSRHAQLAAYQLAVEHGGFDEVSGGMRRSGGASLVQLGRPLRGQAREQVQPPLADDPEHGWADDLLERTAAGMTRPVVQARRGPWCGVCPARPSCPAMPDGQQVTS